MTLPDAGSGSPVAGWYRDPRVPFQLRWWDGEGWSNNVHMPDRTPQPTAANLVPEFAPQPDGKWEWPAGPRDPLIPWIPDAIGAAQFDRVSVAFEPGSKPGDVAQW
ncbi:MAG: DUF2510 domain-containing protein [Galbitalea sp.]